MSRIAIFYHVPQYLGWEILFERQIIALQQSGLYDAADYIHIGINGDRPLPYILVKVNSTKRNINLSSESDTLIDLHKFAKENPEYRIFYLNVKTIDAFLQFHSKRNINLWLDYLEYFNIKHWQTCVELLDDYDCVGTDWDKNTKPQFPHYSGNFWWANANYISELETDFLYDDRTEFWIGTKNPVYYNFHSSDRDKYINPVLPEEYENIEIKPNKNNLKIIHPTLFIEHWMMLSSALNEVYGNEEPESVLSLGLHCTNSLESIKEQYKDCKLIAYQSEPLAESHWFKPERLIDNLKGADEVWDYDLENINLMKNYGINAKFKPPLYTKSLKRVKNLDKPDIDLLFYGSYTEYRFKMLCNFLNGSVLSGDCYDIMANSNLVTIWNKHGEELDEFIGRSKVILNLNPYDGECRQQQTRIFYNLINDKCVLSEKNGINYYGDMIVEFSGFQDLCFKFTSLMRDDTWRKYTQNQFKYHSRKILREGEAVFEDQLRNLQQQ